jgi:hypothetical protein
MQQEQLIAYLRNKMDFENWKLCLQEELDFYKIGLKKLGSSIPIRYDGDNEKISIGQKEIKKLCADFRNGIIDEYFIGYVADALLLSENSVFETEEIKDKFESFSEIIGREDTKAEYFFKLLCSE